MSKIGLIRETLAGTNGLTASQISDITGIESKLISKYMCRLEKENPKILTRAYTPWKNTYMVVYRLES